MDKVMYQKKYKEAFELISLRSYERARGLLEEVMLTAPNTSNIALTLGNVQMLTGYPHLAIHSWSKAKEVGSSLLLSKVQRAEALLSEYDALYERYHHALMLIHKGEHEKALREFALLVDIADRLVLPLPIYYGYFLLLAKHGKKSQLEYEIAQAPQYVQLSQEVNKLQENLATANARSELQAGRRKSKGFVLALSALAVLLAVSIGLNIMPDDEQMPASETAISLGTSVREVEARPVQTQQSQAQDVRDAEENAALSMKLQKAQDMYNEALEKAQSAEALLLDQEQIIESAGVNLDELQQEAGKRTYSMGQAYYKQRNYEQAAKSFQMSRTFTTDSYFADDNLYHWSQTLRKLGKTEEAVLLDNEFLSETSKNYTNSPYLDDVLLERAEYLLQTGFKEEAGVLLQRVINEFPNEWTAARARQLSS